MLTLLAWVAVILLPTAAGYFIVGAVHGGTWLSQARLRPVAPPPADRLVPQLRRLRAELETVEASPRAVAKSHHVRALRGAYLDAGGPAGPRPRGPPPPGGARAPPRAIYRTEADLRACGLDVRTPAVR